MTISLGIDFGTTGARAIAIDIEQNVRAEARVEFKLSSDGIKSWQKALFSLLEQIALSVRRETIAIAINGTSSTVLLCDEKGNPLDAPILYNDGRAAGEVEALKEIAPPQSVVLSATSSLGKLLWWFRQPVYSLAAYFLHQADWLAFLLHGKLGISDYHNALKLGYDIENLCYPHWVQQLPVYPLVPRVVSPGNPVGEISPSISRRFSLPDTCQVCAGTTDSIAAFLASGATQPGEAVTSLGSTLVLKLLSRDRVENARYGIYSHRIAIAHLGGTVGEPDLWLTGGASNTGGAVLRHFFSDEELTRLSQEIDARTESPLDYYPLLNKGDRFPINDPQLPPRLQPRPDNSVEFLHGLLESIARIETQGYQLLQQLGATSLTRIYTAGGGAKNDSWTEIRQRRLRVPIAPAANTAAAYGTALLAMRLGVRL
ncbi:MAG: FGGY-family carbohydrate kinase [Cyanobacteriota bacterium]|nr:FGGY-family carbohydrate kinase [Cyanobacteriota bacterium]